LLIFPSNALSKNFQSMNSSTTWSFIFVMMVYCGC
jgi:hypothetical protein